MVIDFPVAGILDPSGIGSSPSLVPVQEHSSTSVLPDSILFYKVPIIFEKDDFQPIT